MKNCHKKLLVLLAGVLLVTASATAFAHGWRGHWGGQGDCYNTQYTNAMTPEIKSILEKSHAAIAPLYAELRSKQAELTTKIYSGADDKSLQALTQDITSLQSRLTEARVSLQKQLAKAGVNLGDGLGGCPAFQGGMGSGYHGGGFGYHSGPGGCAGY